MQVTARHEGDTLVVYVRHSAELQTVAFNPNAAPLDRLLAAVASGVMQSAVAIAAIRDDEALRAAALALLAREPVTLTGAVVTLRVPLEGA